MNFDVSNMVVDCDFMPILIMQDVTYKWKKELVKRKFGIVIILSIQIKST